MKEGKKRKKEEEEEEETMEFQPNIIIWENQFKQRNVGKGLPWKSNIRGLVGKAMLQNILT